MRHEVYHLTFSEETDYKNRELVWGKLDRLKFALDYAATQNGFLFLLDKDEKQSMEEYEGELDKANALFGESVAPEDKKRMLMFHKHYLEAKDYSLMQIEEAVASLSIPFETEKIDAQIEYHFWVSQNRHSDIIHRSLRANLADAFSEMKGKIDPGHRYYGYALTSIGASYKTRCGYIGELLRYSLPKDLPIAAAIQQDTDLLAYM